MYRMMIAAALLVTTAVASPVMAVEPGAAGHGTTPPLVHGLSVAHPVANNPRPVANNPRPVVNNAARTYRLHRVGGGG
jgi:hypothetical protein